MELYNYRATVVHTVDGDTVDLLVSLGFDMSYRGRFRLSGIDAPESYGPNACEEGKSAKSFLSDSLLPGTQVIVRTFKDKKEKYGRFLAEIFTLDAQGVISGKSLNTTMVEKGYAKVYTGGARG